MSLIPKLIFICLLVYKVNSQEVADADNQADNPDNPTSEAITEQQVVTTEIIDNVQNLSPSVNFDSIESSLISKSSELNFTLSHDLTYQISLGQLYNFSEKKGLIEILKCEEILN